MKRIIAFYSILLLALMPMMLVSCTLSHLAKGNDTNAQDTSVPDTTESQEDTATAPEETIAQKVELPEIGPDTKLVAFTFDDGPSITEKLADLFAEYDGHCTFFVYGSNMQEEKDQMVKKVSQMGCEFANHSKTHPVLTEMTDEEILEELDYTSNRIEELTGKAPRFFRPPYYAYNEKMFDMTDMIFIGGEQAEDWISETTAEQILQKMKYSYNGAIWALHESGVTYAALEEALPYLTEKGFVFVTLSEMMEYLQVPPEKLHGKIINAMNPSSLIND